MSIRGFCDSISRLLLRSSQENEVKQSLSLESEALEQRRLLAVTASWSDGDLSVSSDNASDQVRFVAAASGINAVELEELTANGWKPVDIQGVSIPSPSMFFNVDLDNLIFDMGGGNDVVDTTAIKPGVYFSAGGTTSADLGSGNDKFIGSDWFYEDVDGGAGNDTITLDSSSGSVGGRAEGGDGNDSITGNGSDKFYLYGDDGQDDLKGGDAEDYIKGGDGSDLIYGRNGKDVLVGGPQGDDGHDTLYGGGHNDSLYGGFGNDRLWGGANDDSLYGGFGDDMLDGGDHQDYLVDPESGDSDSLYGGLGVDTIDGTDLDSNDELVGESIGMSGDEGDNWTFTNHGQQ